MSIKKTFLFGVAGFAALSMTAAAAGGYDDTSASTPTTDAGYYVGVDLGYTYQNYKDNVAWREYTLLEEGSSSHNITGGFAGDIHFGYQMNKNYAFELGWVYLPEVRVSAGAWMQNWVLYLAAKYMMPLCPKIKGDVFFKFGLAYRHADLPSNVVLSNNTTINTRGSDYVRPMFALGYERAVFDALYMNMQYAYFMGANNSFPLTTTVNGALGTVAAHVFTLGMAYKFVL